MTIQVIPLLPVPAQSFSISLNGQSCDISVYQRGNYFYLDLTVNNIRIASTRIIMINQRIVRVNYTGFIGDMIMVDTQGNDQPTFDGLGSRWILTYGY